MTDSYTLNALEAFLIADKNDSILLDIIGNSSATDYGATSETWTPDSLQRIFEEELVCMEVSKNDGDENAADYLRRYNSIKEGHVIDWVKVCNYI